MYWVMVGWAIQHYILLARFCCIWVKFMYASIDWEVNLTITHWTERPGCRILCHVRSARTCQTSIGFIGRGGIPIEPCEELEMYPLSLNFVYKLRTDHAAVFICYVLGWLSVVLLLLSRVIF